VDAERVLEDLARSRDLAPFGELVRPLIEHVRERSSNLVRTLRTLFAARGNASEAAHRMFLHRNSMFYRRAQNRAIVRAFSTG
jgi:DNA-binding PucR family transcriptional regulator